MPNREELRIVLSGLIPNELRNKILRAKDFTDDFAKSVSFEVVDADDDYPILAQKLSQQGQPRVHHAEPFVVAREVFGLFPDDLAEPLPDLRAVDVVIVKPVFVAGVVGRVDVDALHLAGVVREQGLEGFEVITLHQETAGFRIAGGKRPIAVQEPIRHLSMVVDHCLFANPIECRHGRSLRQSVNSFGHASSVSLTHCRQALDAPPTPLLKAIHLIYEQIVIEEKFRSFPTLRSAAKA